VWHTALNSIVDCPKNSSSSSCTQQNTAVQLTVTLTSKVDDAKHLDEAAAAAAAAAVQCSASHKLNFNVLTSKVDDSEHPDESGGVPHHMRQGAVDQHVPQRDEDAQAAHVHPAGGKHHML
jgi:hypothetical protein